MPEPTAETTQELADLRARMAALSARVDALEGAPRAASEPQRAENVALAMATIANLAGLLHVPIEDAASIWSKVADGFLKAGTVAKKAS